MKNLLLAFTILLSFSLFSQEDQFYKIELIQNDQSNEELECYDSYLSIEGDTVVFILQYEYKVHGIYGTINNFKEDNEIKSFDVIGEDVSTGKELSFRIEKSRREYYKITVYKKESDLKISLTALHL